MNIFWYHFNRRLVFLTRQIITHSLHILFEYNFNCSSYVWAGKSRSYLTVVSRFEQAFISRLLTQQISQDTQYFWIGLQDIKNTGEYQWLSQEESSGVVTYTNWGWFEPGE